MRIIIIDDDKLVSLSLKTILESGNSQIEVCAIGDDGSQLVALYEEHKPDVVLMDIQMKQMNGIDASAELISRYPDALILLLTTFSDEEYIVKALRVGVKGYILKQNFESIEPAIMAVFNGQTVFGDKVIEMLPSLLEKKTDFDYDKFDITDKEAAVVEMVAQGYNNKEIASELFLSEGTVRNYISTILEKLELRDRTQLAVFYYKNGGK